MNTRKKHTGRSLWLGLVAIALPMLLVGCGGGDSHATVPTVTETSPADAATLVPRNSDVTATFSEAMDASTINTTTFKVVDASETAITGTVTYDAATKTATFTHASDFTDNTVYTATLTIGVKSAPGKPMASNHDWTFTTVALVTETNPADDAIKVAPNSKVTATFSEAMDASTIDTTSFKVISASETAIIGTVSYDADTKTAKFTHTSNFTDSTVYTATITAAVKSSAGIALANNYVWTFTSGTAAADLDITPPEVTSTIPADTNAVTGVALNVNVSANFSEALDSTTVKAATFTLKQGTTSVSGEVSYKNKVATFNPTDNLIAGKLYTATLTTAITDLADNKLAADKVWTFTTGTTVAKGPPAINLGKAANFAIMTGTGISSLGDIGSIKGNIGVSSSAGSYITVACNKLATDFKVYADDATYSGGACSSTNILLAGGALADVLTAYTAASDTATPAAVGANLNIGAGTVTARTLDPGTYTWGTDVNITGDITLDGGADDVWIFQISKKLDLATNTAIILAGTAQAKNVFWRVAETVTLKSGAKFKGIILAKTNIEMIDGATIEGRLLAQTRVDLGTTTVVTPPAP